MMDDVTQDLLRACIVAIDWLADKGIPADHPEAQGITAAIAKAIEVYGEPPAKE